MKQVKFIVRIDETTFEQEINRVLDELYKKNPKIIHYQLISNKFGNNVFSALVEYEVG